MTTRVRPSLGVGAWGSVCLRPGAAPGGVCWDLPWGASPSLGRAPGCPCGRRRGSGSGPGTHFTASCPGQSWGRCSRPGLFVRGGAGCALFASFRPSPGLRRLLPHRRGRTSCSDCGTAWSTQTPGLRLSCPLLAVPSPPPTPACPPELLPLSLPLGGDSEDTPP